MNQRHAALVKFKDGRSSRIFFFGENAKARAEEYADHLPGQDDTVQEVQVAPVEEKDAQKLNESTSPDFKDGHVHPIENIDSAGTGRTAMAGQPPHAHEIKNGIVIPEMGGDAAAQYISYHPGEVGKGAVPQPGTPMADAPPTPAPAPAGTPAGGDLGKLRQLQEFKEKIMKYGELKNVQIFATGVHRGKTFVEAHIDEILKNFEKFGQKIKSPLVLGHDEKQVILQNSGLPSLGTPTRLTKLREADGVKLIADFKDVPEVARTVIEQKRYSRISAELYTDFEDGGKKHGLALRRIALLGADIPEVKTLQDVANMGEEGGEFLLSEGIEIGIGDEGDDEMNKKFAEQIKKLQEDLDAQVKRGDSLEKQLATSATKAHKMRIASFVEKLTKAGKFLPKWSEMGFERFAEKLDSTAVMKFSDADDAKEISDLDFFMGFMESLPEFVELAELAESDPVRLQELKDEKRRGAGDGERNKALDQKAKEYVEKLGKAGTTITYGEALEEVARQNPGLYQTVEA